MATITLCDLCRQEIPKSHHVYRVKLEDKNPEDDYPGMDPTATGDVCRDCFNTFIAPFFRAFRGDNFRGEFLWDAVHKG